MKLGLVGVVMLLLCACETQQPPVTPEIGTPCMRACANMRAAGCPEAETFKGNTCESVCEQSATLLPVACVASVYPPTAEKIRECGRVRCRN